MRRSGTRGAAWLLWVLGLSACGQGPDAADGRGGGGAPGSEPAAGGPPGVPAYPFALVNDRAYPVIVYASAGAGEVLLDTLAAGDSARIEVRVGSAPLKLRAVDLDGNELRSEFIDLPDPASASQSPDSPPLRWVLDRSP